MPLDVIRKRIECALDPGMIGQIGRENIELRQEGSAKTVRREQTVQIAAVHTTIAGDRAFRRAVEHREGTGAIRPIGAADVDFVGVDCFAGPGMARRDAGERFLRRHHRRHIEKAEAGRLSGRALDALGIIHALPEHLIAAADAQRVTAAGARLRGHEFHYSTIVTQPDVPLAIVRDATDATVAETGSRRGHATGTFFHLIAEDR